MNRGGEAQELLTIARRAQYHLVADHPDDFDFRHDLAWTRTTREQLATPAH